MKHSFLVLFVMTGGMAVADVTVLEQIVAKVNNEIITKSELERSRKNMELEMRSRKITEENIAKAIKEHDPDFLRDRIDQMLLVQKGKELNLNVDNEITKYIAEIQLKQKMADPDQFSAWVKEQTGMTYEDFKSETKNSMLTQRVIGQEVRGKVIITKAEITKFYEENKSKFVREERVFLREILISTEGKDAAGIAAAEKKAKDLVARARRNEKFPELARDNSDSESSANYGGLPPYKKGEMAKQLEDLVWEKDRNYVTDPIRIKNGFLILKVEDHQKEGQAAKEEVENEIMEQLFEPRFQPALRTYLTKLREDAFLEIREGYVDSGAAPNKSTKWTDPAVLKPETTTKAQVLAKQRRKKVLWMVPVPGTTTGGTVEGKSKSR
jgi:peptidyl-prolyl cis-trans isomerase SurA